MQKPVPEDTKVNSRIRLGQFLSTNKHFIVLWITLFVAIIGISMVTPLLPVFAEEMGASGIWLGLAFSGFALSQVPLTPVVGKLADKFNKKFFLWLGLLIYTIAAVGYFWSSNYHELVFFRILSGVGAAMVMPIAFSYVGELAPHGHEGRYMGLFNIAMIAGFGIGPVLGGVIYDNLGTGTTFISMAIFSLLGSVIILLFLPKRPPSFRVHPYSKEIAHEKPSSTITAILKDTTIKGIITLQLLFGLLFGTVLAFIGIWMTTVINTGVAQVGIVLSVRSIMSGILSYPFGWLADRMNRTILITVGIGAITIGTFCIPWLGTFALLLGLFVLMGIFESMAIPSVNAITVEKGRNMGMGSVMGIFSMASSLGLVAGSMVGGVIETSLGIVAVFRCAAILGIIGIVIFNIFMLRSTRISKESLGILQSNTLDSASEESADTPRKS